jgi:hypothetical protein
VTSSPSPFISKPREFLTYNSLLPALLVTLIWCGALVFGAMYPWNFLPLFAAAALIGLAGLSRSVMRRELCLVAVGLVLLFTAVTGKL